MNRKFIFLILVIFIISSIISSISVSAGNFDKGSEKIVERGFNYNKYELSDGIYSYIIYDSQVNYLENGNWEPIDPYIGETGCEINYDYCVDKNLYEVHYKKNPTIAQHTKFVNNDTFITYQLMSLNYRNNLDQLQQINITQNVEGKIVNESTNNFIYEDVFGVNISVYYSYYTEYLKENLRIDNFGALPSPESWMECSSRDCTLDMDFVFDYPSDVDAYIDGVIWDRGSTKNTSNPIIFKKNNKVIYTLPKPYAYDTSYNLSYGKYFLKKTGTKLYIIVKTNYSWLNSSITYPVIIDPTTSLNTTLEDTSFYENFPTQINGAFSWTEVMTNVSTNTRRGQIKFNTSSLSSINTDGIFKSELWMYYNDTPYGPYLVVRNISVHHVYNNTWYEEEINWNNQTCGIDFDNPVQCNLTVYNYTGVNHSYSGNWTNWNIRGILISELGNSDYNLSLVLKDKEENDGSSFNYLYQYTTKESTVVDKRPYLNITYYETEYEQLETLIVNLTSANNRINFTTIGFNNSQFKNILNYTSDAENKTIGFRIPRNSSLINATANISGSVGQTEGGVYDNWYSDYAQREDTYGMNFNHTYFWMPVYGSRINYRYNETGDYNISSFSIANATNGVFFNGTYFWFTMPAGVDRVSRFNETGHFNDSYFSVASECDNVQDITFNGTYFWTVCLNDNVYRYNETGDYNSSSFSVASQMDIPTGIHTNSSFIWVTDGGTDKIYRYDMTGTFLDSFDISAVLFDPGAIFGNNTYFWILGYNASGPGFPGDKPRIWRYNVSGTIIYPSNTWVDVVESQGDYEWNQTGSLNETNSPQEVWLNNDSVITNWLSTCSIDNWGRCNASLKIHSDTNGTITMQYLNATYTYNTSYLYEISEIPIRNITVDYNVTKNSTLNTTGHNTSLNISNSGYYLNYSGSDPIDCTIDGTDYTLAGSVGSKYCNFTETIAEGNEWANHTISWDKGLLAFEQDVVYYCPTGYVNYTSFCRLMYRKIDIVTYKQFSIINITDDFTENHTIIYKQLKSRFLNWDNKKSIIRTVVNNSAANITVNTSDDGEYVQMIIGNNSSNIGTGSWFVEIEYEVDFGKISPPGGGGGPPPPIKLECGDGICSADMGETAITCPEDCAVNLTFSISPEDISGPVWPGEDFNCWGETDCSITISNPNEVPLTILVHIEPVEDVFGVEDPSWEWANFIMDNQTIGKDVNIKVQPGTEANPGRRVIIVRTPIPLNTTKGIYQFKVYFETKDLRRLTSFKLDVGAVSILDLIINYWWLLLLLIIAFIIFLLTKRRRKEKKK